MEIDKRKELATYLRWGDMAKISKLAKVSRRTVECWVKGKIKKSVVQPYFVAIATKRKQQVNEEVEKVLQAELEMSLQAETSN